MHIRVIDSKCVGGHSRVTGHSTEKTIFDEIEKKITK